MKVGYYPGCSLHKVAKEYNKSVLKIVKVRLLSPEAGILHGSVSKIISSESHW